jgi:hypothetical protein
MMVELKYIGPETHVSKKDILKGQTLLAVFSLMSAWISAQGPGVLCMVEGRLNANIHIRILEEVMLPSVIEVFPHNDFQHDNCVIHTSDLAQNWLRANVINVLSWPSRSPDINPIENVWSLMIKNMHRANIRPQNKPELINAIRNEWSNLSFILIPRVVQIMSIIFQTGGVFFNLD